MMDADEARRRGLGAPRGLLVVFLFWFVVGAAAMLVLSACQANDADQTELPRVTIDAPAEPAAPPAFSSSQADDVRELLDNVGYGYLDDGDTDATIDEAGRVTCQIFRGTSFENATRITVQAGTDSGLTQDEAIALVAALAVVYCPDVQPPSSYDY